MNVFNEDEQLLLLRYNHVGNRAVCPSCGSVVLYYDSFCHGCGSRLDVFKPDVDVSGGVVVDKNLALRYAGVCLLDELLDNPLLTNFDKGVFNLFGGIDFYDVRNFLIEKSLVDVLYGDDKVLACLNFVPDEFVEYVIKERHLLLGKSREDNVKVLLDNLSSSELDDMFDDYLVLTSQGKVFLDENRYMLFYSRFFDDFDLEYYDAFYNKSGGDLKSFMLDLLEDSLADSIGQLKWGSYSRLLCKYAFVYDYVGDYRNSLYYVLCHLICEVNPLGDNIVKESVVLSIYLKNMLVYAISRADLDYDELYVLVEKAFSTVLLPKSWISLEDFMVLVEELFDGETKLREVNNHLVTLYGVERLGISDTFSDIIEQEKVLMMIDKLF